MRLLLAASLALACAPEKAREFELGLIGPVGPATAAAARAEGLTIRESAPDGAEQASAGVERMDGFAALRLSVARAAVRGREGVFFVLPEPPQGKELTDFPEEWQALARAAREAGALRPIVEAGVEADLPFPLPDGAEGKAWRYQGRVYVLLVNDGLSAVAFEAERLKDWRALFEVRADAREALAPCPAGRCLSPGRALWLEGRL